MELSIKELNLSTLSYEETLLLWGGSKGWDYEVAEALGKGVGYTVKKLWRAFQVLSQGLYEAQLNSQVVHK